MALAGRRGRPSKLSLERLREVIEHVEAGLPQASAAAAAGLGQQTVVDWNRRGRFEIVRVSDLGENVEELVGAQGDSWPTPSDWTATPEPFSVSEWPYLLFSVALQRARARQERRLLQTIEQASLRGQWQAAAWMLERTRPETYARGESRLRVAIEQALALERERRPYLPDPVSVADVERALAELEEADAARNSGGRRA